MEMEIDGKVERRGKRTW